MYVPSLDISNTHFVYLSLNFTSLFFVRLVCVLSDQCAGQKGQTGLVQFARRTTGCIFGPISYDKTRVPHYEAIDGRHAKSRIKWDVGA